MGKKHFDDYDEEDFYDDFRHKKQMTNRRTMKKIKDYQKIKNLDDDECDYDN